MLSLQKPRTSPVQDRIRLRMLAPYPTRLRSHSSPGRPRGSSRSPEVPPRSGPASSFEESVEEASETQQNRRPTPSSPPDTNNGRASRRLKRPSSSSAAMDPSYTSDLQDIITSTSSQTSSQTSQTSQASSKRSSSRPKGRPSTSSGAPERTRVRSSSATFEHSKDSSFFKGFGPIMGVRPLFTILFLSALPMNAGGDRLCDAAQEE